MVAVRRPASRGRFGSAQGGSSVTYRSGGLRSSPGGHQTTPVPSTLTASTLPGPGILGCQASSSSDHDGSVSSAESGAAGPV
jgi:hypothetical protein